MESLEIVNAVQQMQDYIEMHLNEKITLLDLAKASGYSPWYCSRIFKEMTSFTPFEYIRMLRLSKAALILRDSDKKVIDVAFDFVFDSHEGFTRAFSKEFGIAPKYYQENPSPIKLFIPYSVRGYYLFFSKGVNTMKNHEPSKTVFVQVVERPARKIILKRGIKADHYFDYCSEVGCDVWGILTSIKEAIYEPIGMWLPNNMIPEGTSTYVQGVEVPINYNGEIPAGFEIIELKPCKMMIFQGEAFEDEDFENAIGDLWQVMDKYNPEIYGFQWADDEAPRFQLQPLGYRGYIEGRPVKQINEGIA